jgi:Mg2+-importing ATPase
MLPTQILLNNILYDLSEIPIPLEEVDAEELRQPRVLNMHFIRNFMLVVGPVSSLFDFLTFYLMLKVLHAGEALFQTGWFVESLCSQVLVIFVIRTRGNPLRSRAHPLLSVTSLAIVALALVLPYTRLGADFGFVPPPAVFYPLLGGMLLSYLLVVEGIKRWFYRRMNSNALNSLLPKA